MPHPPPTTRSPDDADSQTSTEVEVDDADEVEVGRQASTAQEVEVDRQASTAQTRPAPRPHTRYVESRSPAGAGLPNYRDYSHYGNNYANYGSGYEDGNVVQGATSRYCYSQWGDSDRDYEREATVA